MKEVKRKEIRLPWGKPLMTREMRLETEKEGVPTRHIIKIGKVNEVTRWATMLQTLKEAGVHLGFEPQAYLDNKQTGILMEGLLPEDVMHRQDMKKTIQLGHLSKEKHTDIIANLAQDVARIHAAGYSASPSHFALTHKQRKANGYALVGFDRITNFCANNLEVLLKIYIEEFRDDETRLHFLENYRNALPRFEHRDAARQYAKALEEKIKHPERPNDSS